MTGKAVCVKNNNHIYIEEVYATYELRNQATCEQMGLGVYTATFSDAVFGTQYKYIDFKATGHNWSAPTFTWSEDNSTCTMKRTCFNDSTHIDTETVNTTYQVITPTTCNSKGTVDIPQRLIILAKKQKM